ncbi:MAG: hypothetical protein QW247_09390 [Pyrobaculum sp.]
MIDAAYLPFYRINELAIFAQNVRLLRPGEAALCVDYVHDEWLGEFVKRRLAELGVGNPTLFLGNWQNRSSCLLRLVKYIVERGGDGLIVDSDDLLAEEFLKIDERLDRPLYHVSDIPWQSPRVRRAFENGVEVYYWRVKRLVGRTMHVFAGPKQAIRIKRPVVSTAAVDEVLKAVESLDPLFARVIADETALGIVYDKSGIEEVPFVVAAIHLRHQSYPKLGYSKQLWRKIYAMALARLYLKTGYYLPALRYAATSLVYSLVMI